MTYVITSQCTECHRCESICPTGAIARNEQQYQINSERCNDCVGYYAVPQCWAVCPTNGGCLPDLATPPQARFAQPANDYWDHWFLAYNRLVSRLNANRPSDYWKRWFDTYSQALAKQLQNPTTGGVNA
ncbi:4Fe-4S ferredoxin [Neosynechococcus sphagnicola sy1]|uniref:4Fe-4S ferredoxin n=1 Tax=Neosynechococcus sphagnicola sy1 TaxID=1497020 RepID=A0A098TPI8_9CYAN|nr:4Fe-4S binding protein [Neosynechococcus sphagnicola]KGF73802.1 4Fe-4S ferredoxin [Neosynechococcus sphagnicola sy1]